MLPEKKYTVKTRILLLYKNKNQFLLLFVMKWINFVTSCTYEICSMYTCIVLCCGLTSFWPLHEALKDVRGDKQKQIQMNLGSIP